MTGIIDEDRSISRTPWLSENFLVHVESHLGCPEELRLYRASRRACQSGHRRSFTLAFWRRRWVIISDIPETREIGTRRVKCLFVTVLRRSRYRHCTEKRLAFLARVDTQIFTSTHILENRLIKFHRLVSSQNSPLSFFTSCKRDPK